MLQKLKHKYRQLQAWLEKIKYRNVDVNDPKVQAEIKANEEYTQRQTNQMWFAIKWGGGTALIAYIMIVFEDTKFIQKVEELWSLIRNL